MTSTTQESKKPIITEWDSTFTHNATRKNLNLAPGKKIPDNIVNTLNEGVSLEVLEELTNGKFPVLQYRTQITVHGIWDYNGRGVDYCNMICNGNKSLGVKYSAIDFNKKKIIRHILRGMTARFGWFAQWNSTEYNIIKQVESIAQAKQIYNDCIKPSMKLFNGSVDFYQCMLTGRMYLYINLLCIYEKNILPFIYGICGINETEYQQIQKDIADKADKEELQRIAERKAYADKRALELAEYNKKVSDAISNIPGNYRRIKQDDLKKGKIIRYNNTIDYLVTYSNKLHGVKLENITTKKVIRPSDERLLNGIFTIMK